MTNKNMNSVYPFLELFKNIKTLLVYVTIAFTICGVSHVFLLTRRNYNELLQEISDMQSKLDSLLSLKENQDQEINNLIEYIYNIQMERFLSNTNKILNKNKETKIGELNSSRLLKGFNPSKRIILPSRYILPHLNQKELLKFSYHHITRKSVVNVALSMIIDKHTRKENLTTFLTRILEEKTEQDIQDTVIIILISEIKPKDVFTIASYFYINFYKHLKLGLIEIIAPSSDYYPNFKIVTQGIKKKYVRFDNKLKKFIVEKINVEERAKKNLDFIFLMLYAITRSNYSVYVKPNIDVVPKFMMYIKHFVKVQENIRKWWPRKIKVGHEIPLVGKLFKADELPRLIQFMCLFYKERTIDGLIFYFKNTTAVKVIEMG